MVATDLNMFFGQEDYLSIKQKQELQMAGLVEKFKFEGLPEAEAINKARFIIYKPKALEAEKYEADRYAGVRPSVTFFFDDEAELNYLRKFFDINLTGQVKNCNKLLQILKYYEDTKLKTEGKMTDTQPQVPEIRPEKLFSPEAVSKQAELPTVEEVK